MEDEMSEINRRRFLEIGGYGLAGICGLGERKIAAPSVSSTQEVKEPPDKLVVRSFTPPSEATGILIAAPSTVDLGEEFSLGVKIKAVPYTARLSCFTRNYPTVSSSTNVSPRGIYYMDNVPPKWQGTLEVIKDEACSGPVHVNFQGDAGPYSYDRRPIKKAGPFRFAKPGFHFISLKDRRTGLSGTSNPILVKKRSGSLKLFWGDIHGHTIFTDGIRGPEEVYSFGRDEAFLDICALTDHTEFYLTDRLWEYLTAAANDFYDPGRFVTLVAQEWTNFRLGHRNIYHRGDSAPFIRATDPVLGKLPGMYEFARKHGALVVPHHSAAAAMGVDWSIGHDPEVERLVEIYSCWGNSERSGADGNPLPIHEGIGGEKQGSFVADAFALGRKFGIIASGDVHDGRMGDCLSEYQAMPKNYKYGRPGGLVGVWARELTREAVFEALWNRRVFGTTGRRIFLSFQIADSPMGSTIKGQGDFPVTVCAVSQVPIVRLDLVKNGRDFKSYSPGIREVNWELNIAPTGPSDSFYVRLLREDGEMAWSSPIWIERG